MGVELGSGAVPAEREGVMGVPQLDRRELLIPFRGRLKPGLLADIPHWCDNIGYCYHEPLTPLHSANDPLGDRNMNRQCAIWQGKGERVGAFAHLNSRIFSWPFLGDIFPAFLSRTAIPAGNAQFVLLSPRTGKPGSEDPNPPAKNHAKFVAPLADTGVSDENTMSLEFSPPRNGGGGKPTKTKPDNAGKRKAREMKTCIHNYNKCILSVLLAVSAGLLVAASSGPRPTFKFGFQAAGKPQAAFKLEGAWVAQTDNGIRSLVTFAPNPSGKTGTFRNEMIWPPEILAEFGLSGVTDEIGEQVMTGRNTGTYTARWYGLIDGSPLVVFVDDASITFDSPTELNIVHQITGYIADPDGQPAGDPIVPTGTYHSTSRRITH